MRKTPNCHLLSEPEDRNDRGLVPLLGMDEEVNSPWEATTPSTRVIDKGYWQPKIFKKIAINTHYISLRSSPSHACPLDWWTDWRLFNDHCTSTSRFQMDVCLPLSEDIFIFRKIPDTRIDLVWRALKLLYGEVMALCVKTMQSLKIWSGSSVILLAPDTPKLFMNDLSNARSRISPTVMEPLKFLGLCKAILCFVLNFSMLHHAQYGTT